MTKEEFLFDSNLNTAIENLISEAKEKLVLISPYIDLAPRVRSALQEQLDKKNPNFKLEVLFGKDGLSQLKKERKPKLKESLKYFMQFPNVEIKFNESLHAKYYRNDYHVIFSSMNLYDYSSKVNIEFGILREYSSKGMLNKMGDFVSNKIAETADSINENVMGTSKNLDPIKKFERIFNESETLYKSKAKLKEKSGIFNKASGAIGIKQYELVDKKIKIDKLSEIVSSSPKKVITPTIYKAQRVDAKKPTSNLVSATVLGKPKGLNYKAVVAMLIDKGLIQKDGKSATDAGKKHGIEMKSSDKGEWLVYPEDLLGKI